MRGTFFGLEIGRTGLSTAQFGLDVTSHNIANVDTAGYTRQRIVSTAYDPFATIGKFAPVSQALVGGGVRVQILDQIRSAYLDRRFRSESTVHSYWETRTQSLSYIESFFDNVNEKTSINYSMAEFFKAMTIVATDPVSGAPRTLMQTAAMDLVQQLNMIYDGLIDLQRSENRAVQTKTEDVNRIAKEIAELNKSIYSFEITGMIANDLRDKRNLLVDQLSEYVDIEYMEYPDIWGHDMFKLTVAGVALVDHDRTAELRTRPVDNPLEGEEQIFEVYWHEVIDGSANAGLEIDWTKISGGQIKAHMQVRDGTGLAAGGSSLSSDSRLRGIPYYIEMVNNLARALVDEVNKVHREGWSDNPLGSQTGINFFYEDNEWVTWTGPGGEELQWDEALEVWTWTDGVDTYTVSRDPVTGEYTATGADIADFTRALDIAQVTARNIRLSDEIVDNAFNIAASSTQISRAGTGEPEEAQRGNNVNMNELYKLFSRSDIFIDVGGVRYDIGSFDDYGTVIRFDLGNTLHTAKQSMETSRILKLAAENQRTAIAGVSLDEEMVGLVKYQHAYNGAARVITAMDDALDRLINGTGRVGL
ncbi:MAG: flagellar hook-associated protein FlgK [Oscillospiraceae bacterium]|nr:flagellar hook-associated protein FlgK [Oscillospiraceae bacterium]